MKMYPWLLSLTLTIPAALAGQDPNPGDNARQLSKPDLLFLHTLASEDQSEIDLANLALKKSSNPQVQQYARTKILAADPAMEQGAKQIAEQHHFPLSSSPNPTAKAQFNDLSQLSGSNFDRAYIGYENKQQAADLKVVQGEIGAAQDPQVRDYAQKEEKPVQQASQAAAQLAKSMNIDSRP